MLDFCDFCDFYFVGDAVDAGLEDRVAEEAVTILCVYLTYKQCVFAAILVHIIIYVDRIVLYVVQINRIVTEGFKGDGLNVLGRCTGS